MQKYSFGRTLNLKSGGLTLALTLLTLATTAMNPARITQAATQAMQQTAATLKAAIAPAMMQATICATPTMRLAKEITLDVGATHYFAAGDLNGDGKPDLAVQTSAGKLYGLIGDGLGNFTIASTLTLPSGGPLTQIATGDVNGDGKMDVVTLATDRLRLYTGDGSGRFTIGNQYAVNALGFYLGDFNKDGKADMAVTLRCCPDGVVIYLSDATGHIATSFAWGSARVSAVADFNRDGNLDILTSDKYYPSHQVRLGNGRGQFTNGDYLYYGAFVYFFAATDFNNDGSVDVFGHTGLNRVGQPDANSGKLILLSNNGTGNFSASHPSFFGTLSTEAWQGYAADFTGDGNVDFIDPNTSLYVNNGSGGFCTPTQLLSTVHCCGEQLVSSDLNGDSKADLLHQNGDKIEVWLNGSGGSTNTPPTITPATLVTFLQGQSSLFVSLATVSDAETPAGNLTVTVTKVPAGITVTGLSNGNGSISANIDVSCTAAVGQNLIELTVTDANGSSAKANYTLNVLERTGSNIFSGVPATITVPLGLGAQYPVTVDQFVLPTSQISAGFTGNVSFFGGFTNNMSPIAGSGPLLRLSNVGPVGSYSLTLSTTTRCGKTVTKTVIVNVTGETAACPFPKYGLSTLTPFAGMNNAKVADFNKDGKLDLAIAYTQPANTLGILLGNGSGGFAAPRSYEAGKVSGTIHVGDFNGDTYPDLIAVGGGTNWTILLNDKSGGFTALAKPASAQTISLNNAELYGDVNKDGKMDIVKGGDPFTVLLSNGDGSFTPVISAPTGVDPSVISAPGQIGDFNGDGNLDVAAKRISNGFFISYTITGNGTGAFPAGSRDNIPFQYGAFSWVLRDGIARDFNKDGLADAPIIGGPDPEAGAPVAFQGTFAAIPAFGGTGIAGDYNGDGNLDILFTDGRIILNRGSDPDRWCAAPGGYNGNAQDVGDFDGDGKTDVAVFRRSTGQWLIKLSSGRSSDEQYIVKTFGVGTDTPVAADYDGDGKTDLAVWRGGTWYIWESTKQTTRVVQWGTVGDQTAAGDYDGDGKADVMVWRPATGPWFVKCSGDGAVMSLAVGRAGDQPVLGRH